MKLILFIQRKFPIRNTRNVSNRNALRISGDTLAEIKAEVQTYIDADAFSYGTIPLIQLFNADDWNADCLVAKPVREWKTLEGLMQ